MTSLLDIRNDAPGALRTEAMGITLKFDRTGPDTARVSWNIPRPAAGCTAETQAYCGIVITLDTTSNNSTKLPVSGTVYSSDPTGDSNLFAGDMIGTSKVVGAFYEDRHSTFLDVSGLQENTAYFVSGFPVDCQHRYYKEGVHAYSLDYKQDGTQPTNGTQVVVFAPDTSREGGIEPTDATGLDAATTYSFKIRRGLVPRPQRPVGSQECVPTPFSYTIEVEGAQAQTYDDLLDAINIQLQLVDDPPQSPTPPNTGGYYFDRKTNRLQVWDGHSHTDVNVIVKTSAPNGVVNGSFWYDTAANVLKRWNGAGWLTTPVINYHTNPSVPECEGVYWFNSTVGHTWSGNAWCQHTTHIGTTDPSLYRPAPCGSFWYNTQTFELSSWDDKREMWVSANAVQYSQAPNQLSDGTYWFNTTINKLFAYNTPGIGWNELSTARIAETEPTLTVVAGTLWYNPSTMVLKQRNVADTAWTTVDLIVFESDPTVVEYCSNWWDTTTDTIKVWDGVNSVWVTVVDFYQQPTDPTDPPAFEEGELWYNPSTNKLHYWQNNCFISTPFLMFVTDPRTTIPDGYVWHDTTNDLWFVKTSAGWDPIDVTFAETDPNNLAAGTMWYNPTSQALQMWNGAAWVSITYSIKPLTPAKSAMWFDTTSNKLMTWNGHEWVFGKPLLKVEFNCNGNFIFTDTTPGSLSWASIENIDLFDALTHQFRIDNPEPGTDGVSSEPLYNEVGIGTDGTHDERLAMQNGIRYALGYPTVDVELQPEQLDFAIDRAISTLRANSSIAYKRGFFFLQVHGNTQKYLLTNKISGMNKIVNVLGVHRLTSAFLSSAHGAGVYGQIVLQHLYNMGTFDLLSYHIMTEYTKNLEILFAGRITYNWNEQTRELWIHHRFPFAERLCLIDAAVERTEQELMSDRITGPWIRKWATAEAMLILANTRGKYVTLPGAGGGVSLNANDLRTQAQQDKDQCMGSIFDFVTDTPEDWGLNSTIIFG